MLPWASLMQRPQSPERPFGSNSLDAAQYDSSMTTEKIAISLPREQVESARRAVEQGRSPSVSRYISQAVARAEQIDSLEALLNEMDSQYGPVDEQTMKRVDEALGLG